MSSWCIAGCGCHAPPSSSLGNTAAWPRLRRAAARLRGRQARVGDAVEHRGGRRPQEDDADRVHVVAGLGRHAARDAAGHVHDDRVGAVLVVAEVLGAPLPAARRWLRGRRRRAAPIATATRSCTASTRERHTERAGPGELRAASLQGAPAKRLRTPPASTPGLRWRAAPGAAFAAGSLPPALALLAGRARAAGGRMSPARRAAALHPTAADTCAASRPPGPPQGKPQRLPRNSVWRRLSCRARLAGPAGLRGWGGPRGWGNARGRWTGGWRPRGSWARPRRTAPTTARERSGARPARARSSPPRPPAASTRARSSCSRSRSPRGARRSTWPARAAPPRGVSAAHGARPRPATLSQGALALRSVCGCRLVCTRLNRGSDRAHLAHTHGRHGSWSTLISVSHAARRPDRTSLAQTESQLRAGAGIGRAL